MLGYKLSYRGLVKTPAPINLTLSVTNKCNSRCRSCDIWKIYPAEKKRLANELSIEEIEKVFKSVGPVYFFNISGGEPFLRSDLPKIVAAGCRYLSPTVVHIPTNALMPDRIEATTIEILEWMQEHAPGVKLTLKPSMDGVGKDHDWVRGVAGNYKKLMETVSRLGALRKKYPHLKLGVGTVISTMNIHKLPGIIDAAMALDVDTYISEIAEERAEMRNVDSDITPPHEAYSKAINPFKNATRERLMEAGGMELLTQAMRVVYYDVTKRWLKDRRQILPCYAGISNVHLSPYGEVWPCAVLGDSKSLGNVKDAGLDFWKLWHGEKAQEVRASIKRKECDCPLANQNYANILLSPSAMTQVTSEILKSRVRRLKRTLGFGDTSEPAANVDQLAREEQPVVHPFDIEADNGGRRPKGLKYAYIPKTPSTESPAMGSPSQVNQ
jgi:MoaA/NifB/PqqE/SkfB family radical SAM enzyme